MSSRPDPPGTLPSSPGWFEASLAYPHRLLVEVGEQQPRVGLRRPGGVAADHLHVAELFLQLVRRLAARGVEGGGLDEQRHHAGLQAVCPRRGAHTREQQTCLGLCLPARGSSSACGVHCLAEAS